MTLDQAIEAGEDTGVTERRCEFEKCRADISHKKSHARFCCRSHKASFNNTHNPKYAERETQRNAAISAERQATRAIGKVCKCGKHITQARNGQPRLFCSDTCKVEFMRMKRLRERLDTTAAADALEFIDVGRLTVEVWSRFSKTPRVWRSVIGKRDGKNWRRKPVALPEQMKAAEAKFRELYPDKELPAE